jgi:restriction endonuclease S subunit
VETNLTSVSQLIHKRSWSYVVHSKTADLIKKAFAASNFPVVNLGSVVDDISGGLTPLGAQYPETGINFLRVGNIQTYGLDLSDLVHVSKELHEGELKRSQLMAGDVLLAITGATFGKACVTPEDILPANINQHIAKLRTNSKVVPTYLAEFINSKLGRMQCDVFATGHTRPALSYRAIREMLIPLPPRKIQEQIAKHMHDAYARRKMLLAEASHAITEAKAQVERMILGEEADA